MHVLVRSRCIQKAQNIRATAIFGAGTSYGPCVNGSPDLPDISMNVTVTAVFFIFSVNIAQHLYLKRGVARVSCSKSARHWLRRLPPSRLATRHY